MKKDPQAEPIIIAISNRKGGTGKTTVSVNLAATMAGLGKNVLLIDLDSQGHCAVGLGIKPGKDKPKIHHLFRDKSIKLIDTVIESQYPRLSISPADQSFEHGSGIRDETILTQALNSVDIVSRFDVIIIDTPPSFDLLLLNALTAAQWVLIPFVPHHLSFEGVRQLTRVLFKVMSTSNPKLKILGFLPMMVAKHIRQHRSTIGHIANDFGAHRVLEGVRNDIRLAEAFAAGCPIHYYGAKSRGAEDFIRLGKSINKLISNTKVPEKAGT